MPPWLRTVFSIFLIVLTVLGLVNVYADNGDVLALAGKTACADCSPHLVQVGRSPIAQTITYQTVGSTLVTVICERNFILFGEYQCHVNASSSP